MSRELIYRDDIFNDPIFFKGGFVANDYERGYLDALDRVKDAIEVIPTVGAEEVVYAYWEPCESLTGYYRCSNCKTKEITFNWEKSPFCSECGARMDRKENN